MKKRKASNARPATVTKTQRRSAQLLLAFIGSFLVLTLIGVLYSQMNSAGASEVSLDKQDDSWLTTMVLNILNLEKEEAYQYVTAEEAVTLEELFNAETQAIHDDLIEDAEFHAEQIECLVKALYFEAAREPELGKRWIFDVIVNRTALKWRGMQTYCDVIYDYKQFSFANLTKDRVPDNNRFLIESRDVVLELYGNPHHRDITCGATHYLNVDIATDLSWYEQALNGTSPEGLTVLAKVGNHTFLGKEGNCN